MDDLDARLARYGIGAKPPADDVGEVEAMLARYDTMSKAPAAGDVITIPPQDSAALEAKIRAGMLPLPGGLRTAGQAIAESSAEVGQQLVDQTLGGIPGRVIREVEPAVMSPLLGREAAQRIPEMLLGPRPQPIPEPGKVKRPEDYLPTERTLTGIPAAAIDMAVTGGPVGEAGETLAQGARQAAEHLGALPGRIAARPGVQNAISASGGGALYGGADAAVRGGGPVDVFEGAGMGAVGGLAAGQLPAIAGVAERELGRQVVRNDLKPVKQMSKKGSLDKAMTQFGNGDPEVGAQQMLDFVQRENLGPIFREKGQSSVRQLEARKNHVWHEDLEPIYRWARAAEPNASVPMDVIESRLRATVSREGGNEAELVGKAIAKLRERNESLRSRRGISEDEMPLDVLLTNARDFQSAGHAGVVNYQDPPESKMVAREVGRALRGIANDRVIRVYERHPDAAFALYSGVESRPPGVTFRNQPSTPSRVRAEQYPDAWARWYNNMKQYAESVPQRLAAGNRRYSDYAKLEPLVEQSATLKAGEKNFGLIDLLRRSATGGAAGLIGYGLGDVPGMAIAVGAKEATRAAMPYVTRKAATSAGYLSGPSVSNGLPGALAAKELEDRR